MTETTKGGVVTKIGVVKCFSENVNILKFFVDISLKNLPIKYSMFLQKAIDCCLSLACKHAF